MNYESYSFGATVTIEHGDLGFSNEEFTQQIVDNGDHYLDTAVQDMQTLGERYLDQLLIADIQSAQGITEEHRSFVLRAFTTTTATEPPSTTPRSARGKNTDQPTVSRSPRKAASRTPRSSGYQASGYP